jgi:outer membrane protein assembly factor BamB
MKRSLMVCALMMVLTSLVFAQPELSVSPNPLKFGYISINGSQQRDVIFYNIGDQNLVVDSAEFIQPFGIESIDGLTIAPGDSAIVQTSFDPVVIEYYHDPIIIHYNNPTEPQYEILTEANCIRGFEPGEIMWSFQHIENVVCVTATEDFNGDGLPDVAAEGYDAGAQGDPLVCLSGSGIDATEVIWSVHPQGGPSSSGGYGDDCLWSCSDLNGDGHGDLIRGGAWGSRTIFAIDGETGATIWTYDTYANPPSGWIYSVDQMGDITGDGVGEVLAAAGSDANRAYCLNGATGELIWYYTADDGVSSIKSLSDVNGDGYDDAVFSSLDYGVHVYCVSGNSPGPVATPIWVYDIDENTYSISTIGDVNDDGYEDVIAGTWGSGVVALSGYSENYQGTLLWNYPLGNNIMRVISCPDLNDDGYEDVLVASWSSYTEAVSGHDGSSIWRTYTGNNTWAVDYTDDINGDGVIEVVSGSFTHNVYLMDGVTGAILWQNGVFAKPFSLRGISDVNGDGYSDIIVGTQMLNNQGGQVIPTRSTAAR